MKKKTFKARICIGCNTKYMPKCGNQRWCSACGEKRKEIILEGRNEYLARRKVLLGRTLHPDLSDISWAE